MTALLRTYAAESADVVGVDMAPPEVARKNLESFGRTQIYQKDLMEDLSELGKFDLIYCQEVLHHTEDPRRTFLNLCSSLSEGGEIAIYVYKLKAPLREYADDYVRDKISELPYKEAMRASEQIAALGGSFVKLEYKVFCPFGRSSRDRGRRV